MRTLNSLSTDAQKRYCSIYRVGRLVRYNISRLLLRTVWKHKIREVEMEKCMNPLGFSFGKNGWHCLVEYLRELESNPDMPIEDSILYRFHKRYQPLSIRELVVAAGMEVDFDPGFFRYPWGDFKTDFDHTLPEKDKHRTRFCGPSDESLIEADALNIKALRDTMKYHGYNPWKYPNSFIGGVFLCKDGGDYRFVVLQGNHRVAVMSYLGIERFQVIFLKNRMRCIEEKDIDTWYYVKKVMCTKEAARKYFDAFFTLNGTERAPRFLV